MQLPAMNASSEVHLAYADHVVGAAEAWADAETITAEQKQVVKDVGSTITSAANSLRTAATSADDAQRAVNLAFARFGVRDVILDLRVMGLSDAILNGPAGRDRENPIFKHVFSKAQPHQITNGTMRKEPDVVEVLLARYDSAPDFAGKADAKKPLADALSVSQAARDDLIAKEKAARIAAVTEHASRRALRTSLEQVYGKLRTAFPGRREFVESFFPKRARSENKKDAPENGHPAAPPLPSPMPAAAPNPAG
jgi:hypothetical protein